MPESESSSPVIVHRTRDTAKAESRSPLTRNRNLRFLGAGLVVYGVLGVLIFAIVAIALTRPLDRIGQLSQSVEEQRALLVDSMLQGETTIREMAAGVRRMDTSLTSARSATDRSSQIAVGVAESMFQLRDAMSISILGAQPLIGLAAGFDQTGSQLLQLSSDLTTIGVSLETNATDIVTTAVNLDELADTVNTLKDSVESGPDVGISAEARDAVRIAIFAVAGWLLLFAVGCVVVGAYLFRFARRESGEAA
jgi:hypothetical protein